MVKDNELKDRARLTIPPYHPDTPEVREIWGRYKDAAPATEVLCQTLRDEAPDPRIGAAWALCNLGHEDEALPVLIEALEHESIFIRLRSLNALLRIGDKARPALPHVRAARMDQTTAQIVPYRLDNTINTFLTRFGEDPLPKAK